MVQGSHRHNLSKLFIATGLLAITASIFFLTQERKSSVAVRPHLSRFRKEITKTSHDQNVQKFSLTGFDEQGKKFWNLEGDTATIDSGQTVFLDQNVTLKLKESTIIKTDHVQWSQDGGILRTHAPVFVTHENTEIKGLGAFGRLNESFIQLNRDIEMLIDQSTLLTCQGPLKIFYKDNKMIFYRKVKVVDDRGVLKANRMDVIIDPVKKKVSQIIAMGNVTVQRGTDTTHSQRAIYSVATGSVRLEGNPEITLHKDSAKILDAPLRN